jgi:hypothetical protein
VTSSWCYSRLDSGLPQTIVAMITSNMARAGHPSRVVVRVAGERANGSGLLMDSVIMTDNLATVRYAEIDRVIGTFPEPVNRCGVAYDSGTVAAEDGRRRALQNGLKSFARGPLVRLD